MGILPLDELTLIFQGLAIALMAGGVAFLLLSRMTVPVVYYIESEKSS